MASTTAEGSFTLSDGLQVYTQTWKTQSEKPVASAFFLHGFSDHCNAYYELFPTLASKGIEVFGFDQRGWGRTCANRAQRGLTGPNSQLLQDIDELLIPRLTLAESQGIPLFLLGHSNGGGIAIYYSIFGTYRNRLAGLVAESPLLNLAPGVKPFGLTVFAGKIAAKILPNRQMVNKLDPKTMSRDKEVCRKFDEDTLCHDTGTLIQLAEMLGRGKSLMKEETLLKFPKELPVLVAHGTADKVTCHETSKNWVDRIRAEDKTFVSYEGWYHKLHAELGEVRHTFANDVAAWILDRTGSVPKPSKVDLTGASSLAAPHVQAGPASKL
ncbi:Alpha/Beta hydrolase protein [Peziza echinospora]|nr:Alpha/Beta hydrolase protein [Peziza echinospora]